MITSRSRWDHWNSCAELRMLGNSYSSVMNQLRSWWNLWEHQRRLTRLKLCRTHIFLVCLFWRVSARKFWIVLLKTFDWPIMVWCIALCIISRRLPESAVKVMCWGSGRGFFLMTPLFVLPKDAKHNSSNCFRCASSSDLSASVDP
jgi:hypothetical protein